MLGGECINRIGIIFNFLAGVLLGPDLIGRVRLKRIERDLKDWLLNVTLRIAIWASKGRLHSRWALEYWGSFVFWGMVAALVIELHYFLLGVLMVILILLVGVRNYLRLTPLPTEIHAEGIRDILDFSIRYLFYVYSVSPLMFLFWISVYGFLKPSAHLNLLIITRYPWGRSRGVIIAVGLVLFLMDNALQLLATFIK